MFSDLECSNRMRIGNFFKTFFLEKRKKKKIDFSFSFKLKLFDKVVELVGGGSVINGAYPF